MSNDTIVGYDSTTGGSIPSSALLVFPYINGSYVWDPATFAPRAKVKSIDVIGDRLDADICDCERFDLTVPGAINWARSKYAQRNEIGTVYCTVDELPSLFTGLVGVPHYYFIADPTGVAHIRSDVPGCVATQYANLSAQNLDVSLALADWVNNVSPAPTPNTPAPCIGGRITKTGKGYWMVGADGGVFTQGDAAFHGSAYGKLTPPEKVVSFDITPSGNGYILFTDHFDVFTFGDANFEGHPTDPPA